MTIVQSLIWAMWKAQTLLAVPVSLAVILLYVRIALAPRLPAEFRPEQRSRETMRMTGSVLICVAFIAALPHELLCLVGLLLPELTVPENQHAGLGWLVRNARETGYITDFVSAVFLPGGLLLLGFAIVKNGASSPAIETQPASADRMLD